MDVLPLLIIINGMEKLGRVKAIVKRKMMNSISDIISLK